MAQTIQMELNMNPSIPNHFSEPDRRIRMPEVKSLTGLSKRTIYRRIAEGKFPQAVKDGHISAWWLSHVKKYLGINAGEK
jgi:predicted DNA-binding transcriptional regulator AlpA